VDSRVNYLLLATALLGTFFSGTATRIVSISMPTVAQSLGTDLLGVSWALLSYQLSNIGLSVIFGRISDLWGREKMFALGFFVFAVSSLLCGFSQTVLQLILARFVQGVGGAMLQSSSRALASESVTEDLAGRAQGYMTTAHHTGFIFGPSIGGLMIDYFSWRWSFFLLAPVGFGGMLLALMNMKRRQVAPQHHPGSVDYIGAALLFAHDPWCYLRPPHASDHRQPDQAASRRRLFFDSGGILHSRVTDQKSVRRSRTVQDPPLQF
jgi:MFS family permease